MRPSTKIAKDTFKDPIIAVEVGVYQGDNALSILQNLPIKRMYLIDPYEVFVEPSSKMGRSADFPDNEYIAREKLKDYDCLWIKKRSDQVEIEPVDFVYIDGSHEYENVMYDLEYFYEVVKPGGILAGHDYNAKSGVKRAVNEFTRQNGIEFEVHHPDWVIRK